MSSAKVVQAACVLFVMAVWISGEAQALTMEEAVGAALENNHKVREYMAAEGQARAGAGQTRAAFFPSLGLEYAYSDSSEAGATGNKQNSSFAASASYNVFSGMEDLHGLRQARASAGAASLARRTAEAELVLSAKKAYIGVLRAERGVGVAREYVGLLDRQLRDASIHYREGMIAKNDLLRVEVELSSARQGLLEAEGGGRVARRTLARITGVMVADDELLEDFPQRPAFDVSDMDALYDEGLGSRSEIAYYARLVDAQREGVAAARAGYYPSVDVSMSHIRYGDSAMPGGVENSYDDETKAVLSATWTLFDGFRTRYGVLGAAYALRGAEEALLDKKAALRLELEEAVEGYRVASGKLEVAETGLGQAEENYRVTSNRYRERVATTVDLLDAGFFLTRARNETISALYDLHEAYATLMRVLERTENGP